jgi:prepilin-type N-terminal cleavage/methylation domain-containing protein
VHLYKEKTMNPTVNQARKKRAFTIIELLTVMSIIVILIGLMVPALNKVRRFARDVQQMAQFNAISAAIELFNNEFDGYPPSGALDSTQPGQPYCGAMKLTEALMGQDLLGVHSNTAFRRDRFDATGTINLYPDNIDNLPAAIRDNNLKARKGPYLQSENANAVSMEDIYGANVGPFSPNTFVLCDVYDRQMRSSEKTGMPILYYRADTANTFHNPALQVTRTDSMGNIYNYWDNHELVQLGKPWLPAGGSGSAHRLADPERFYKNTQSDQITTTQRPYRADTYILISAGWDGEYGTADDICNFKLKYKE